jgi:hypothetical protein
MVWLLLDIKLNSNIHMNRFKIACFTMLALFSLSVFAQETETEEERPGGHENVNKFRQLYGEMSTPNQYRTGSGAPGSEYYQNTADYKMTIDLNDDLQTINGYEMITYTNNSPDDLEYLWVQLDQNVREPNSPAKEKNGSGISAVSQTGGFVGEYMAGTTFDGGFKVTEVSKDGKPLKHTINWTMMRVDMKEPLKAGDSYSFTVRWNYNIPEHTVDRARSGFDRKSVV